LPVIGEVFKSTNTVVKNSELVVFLSPHIYKAEPISAEAMAKFKEIKDRPMLGSRSAGGLSLPNDDEAEK
jgi:type II secretory pathway component GspD/PulD (secretin)